MPEFQCTDPEPRSYPQVATALGDDGEPTEFTAHELEAGDVISAALNPDPARFVEVQATETTAERKKREKAELEVLAALTPEEQAALQTLSPEDVKALSALAG